MMKEQPAASSPRNVSIVLCNIYCFKLLFKKPSYDKKSF